MADFKYNRVLLLLIVVGLVAAIWVGWQRHNVEISNNQIELVMDYEDAVALAQIEGLPPADVFRQLKEAGITSLAVYETTLEKLNKSGKITALPGAEILHRYRTGALADPAWRSLVENGRIRPEDVYVTGQDKVVFMEVYSDLVRRLSPERVNIVTAGSLQVIQAKGSFEKLVKWNLGLPTDEMKDAAAQGFYVVARPTNYTKVTAADVEAVFERLALVDNLSAVMFVGEEILGYPDLLPQTVRYLKARDLTLAMIEHPLQLQFVKQEGLMSLAAANDFKAARVYVIPKDEQPKLKLAEAVQRWVMTDRERNIRMNLLRIYEKPEPGKTLIETNLRYVAGVKAALVDHGFTIGRAGTFVPYFPHPLLLAVIITGAVAAGVLYLTQVRPFAPSVQYILTIVIAALLIVPVLKGGGTLVRQAAALVSAVVFPVLAVTWQLDRWRKKAPLRGGSLLRILSDGVGALTVTVLLSLIGGIYVGALLADVRFLLEMEIYRGVKLTFVAPLLLVSLTYLARFNLFEESGEPGGLWRQVIKMLDYPVYLKTLIFFALGAVVAWVYVGRSGHTAGVPVPAAELKLRAFLENAMYARPREKEFMIAHPAFMLSVMALYRRWPRVLHFILVVVATIGQGSLVETFAHLRTPIFMSAVRGLDGLLLGALLGILAVVGVQMLHYLSYLFGRRS